MASWHGRPGIWECPLKRIRLRREKRKAPRLESRGAFPAFEGGVGYPSSRGYRAVEVPLYEEATSVEAIRSRYTGPPPRCACPKSAGHTPPPCPCHPRPTTTLPPPR